MANCVDSHAWVREAKREAVRVRVGPGALDRKSVAIVFDVAGDDRIKRRDDQSGGLAGPQVGTPAVEVGALSVERRLGGRGRGMGTAIEVV
jgi:hypothetical protein